MSCVSAPKLNFICNSYDALNRLVQITGSIGLVATAIL